MIDSTKPYLMYQVIAPSCYYSNWRMDQPPHSQSIRGKQDYPVPLPMLDSTHSLDQEDIRMDRRPVNLPSKWSYSPVMNLATPYSLSLRIQDHHSKQTLCPDDLGSSPSQ